HLSRECSLEKSRLHAARGFYGANPLLEFLAGLADGIEQKVDRRPGIVLAFVPTLPTLPQHFVIAFLVLFDQAFEADVAAYLQPVVIAGEQQQEPRNPAVAIAEWMNAKEVEIQRCEKHERVSPS